MNNFPQNLMADFLVTFFIKERKYSRMMSEVVKNRHNALYREALCLPSDFNIPFFQEEKGNTVLYTMKQNVDDPLT